MKNKLTKNNILILGAGVSGIGASYELFLNNVKSTILEKNSSWGGLVDNFKVNGFRFDTFIHLSFSKLDYVTKIFKKTPLYHHKPISYNFFKGKWLKHPVQNNLFSLSNKEKEKILKGFKNRKKINLKKIKNYEEWLRVQYGDEFAEIFPMPYTKKYWTLEAKELETKWVNNRMHVPSYEEVEKGCYNETKENKYYADEMRYPKKGGYKSFLDNMVKYLDIELNNEIIKIDTKRKKVITQNKKEIFYDILVSSIPITEIVKLIENVPSYVIDASNKLKFTSGFIVSLGFNKPDIPKHLWFYIYDNDIPVARVYSPSIKSKNNVPPNCSSLQAEIYIDFKDYSNISFNKLLNDTINKLIDMKLFK